MIFFSCKSYDPKSEDICISAAKSQNTNPSLKSTINNENNNQNDLDQIQTNEENDEELEVIDYPYMPNNFSDFTKSIFNTENNKCFLSLRKTKDISNSSNMSYIEQNKEILENTAVNELGKKQTKFKSNKNMTKNNNLNKLIEEYEEEDTIKDQTSRALAPLKNVIDDKKNYILINNNINNNNNNSNNNNKNQKQKKLFKEKNNYDNFKKIFHSSTELINAINNGDYSCNNYFQSTDNKFNLKLSIIKNNNANKKIFHSIRKINHKLYDIKQNKNNKKSKSMKNVSIVKKSGKIINQKKNLFYGRKNKSLGKIIFRKYNNNRKSIKNEKFINVTTRRNYNKPILHLLGDTSSHFKRNKNIEISAKDRINIKNNSETNIRKKMVKSFSNTHMKILKNKQKN